MKYKILVNGIEKFQAKNEKEANAIRFDLVANGYHLVTILKEPSKPRKQAEKKVTLRLSLYDANLLHDLLENYAHGMGGYEDDEEMDSDRIAGLLALQISKVSKQTEQNRKEK